MKKDSKLGVGIVALLLRASGLLILLGESIKYIEITNLKALKIFAPSNHIQNLTIPVETPLTVINQQPEAVLGITAGIILLITSHELIKLNKTGWITTVTIFASITLTSTIKLTNTLYAWYNQEQVSKESFNTFIAALGILTLSSFITYYIYNQKDLIKIDNLINNLETKLKNKTSK